jgi:hypothetical protein
VATDHRDHAGRLDCRIRRGYLLLLSSLAAAAGPALVLPLIFITGCGIIIGMQNGTAAHRNS